MNYPQTHSDYLSYLSYFLVYCVIGIIYLKKVFPTSLESLLAFNLWHIYENVVSLPNTSAFCKCLVNYL